MTTRRQFLASCSALTLVSGFLPGTLLAGPFPPADVSLDQISFDVFASRVGSVFKIVAQGVRLELTDATLIPSRYAGAHLAEDAQNEKFSLLFRHPGEAALRQNTYAFEHPDIGRFAMFIVPVKTRDAGRAYYQAVFNRSGKLTPDWS